MVDGAVVMAENSIRITAEGRVSGREVNRTNAVLTAAREIANPTAFAILIIIVVFLPLFSLEGLEGKLFKPMAFNISFAMVGLLVLTLTLIPMLAALILKPKEERGTLLMRVIKRRYLPLQLWSLAHKKSLAGAALILLTASLALYPLLGSATWQGIHAPTARRRDHVADHLHPFHFVR
jgi:cobalt-zinc-cadmium resistance protein CzcA